MILKICRRDGKFTVHQSRNLNFQFDEKHKESFTYWDGNICHPVNLNNVSHIFLMNDKGDTIEKLYEEYIAGEGGDSQPK